MATTQQPLAVKPLPQAPAAFGSRDEIQAIAKRMYVMMPSARLTVEQENRADRDLLRQRLDNAVYRAAQLCVFYRLIPGEDVHIIHFKSKKDGDQWVVDMGIETWKKAADRYCSLHDISYHVVPEEMSLEELKQRRGEDYKPEDCGVVAYLWRSDKQGVYELFGAKQSMTRAAGVWRHKGQGGYPDTIPAHRTKHDVAKRRAMKAALKLEFSLDSLLAATPAEVRGSIDVMNSRLDSEERQRAPMLDRTVEVDENGFIVEPSASKPPQDVQFWRVAEDGTYEQDTEEEPQADFDGLWDDDAADVDELPPGIDYVAIADNLEGACRQFVAATKNTHANSNGPATAKQYQYLAGVINKLTGHQDSHNDVLGVLIGRTVDSSNPPGFDLCQKLLDYLVKEKSDRDRHGTKVKVPNIAYRQDYADCVVNIWHKVCEAQP